MNKDFQLIRCGDMSQFLAVIADLARHGFGFVADAERLEIRLSGGF